MTKLKWDQPDDRIYETGVKYGVLYPQNNGVYAEGVAWNGLTAVTESPSGAEFTPLYADDIKYLNLQSVEEFGATVEAYTYPDEWAACDGSATIAGGVTIGQQPRKPFGLCYRTTVGNASEGIDYGYKIHLIYGATASPSERNYNTVNDSPEATTLSWELTTTPVEISGFKSTASLVIDSTKADPTKLSQLEDILYGSAGTQPRLPLPDEVADLMGDSSVYAISNQLVNVLNNNDATTIASGTAYNATLSAPTSYTIKNVVVLMGGSDVTETAYTSSTHKVAITSVTGPISIYATANHN